MRTGVVNANLVEPNNEARLPYIPDLIARKQSGENTTLENADVAFLQSEYERLRVELQAAHDASQLREVSSDETRAALNGKRFAILKTIQRKQNWFSTRKNGRGAASGVAVSSAFCGCNGARLCDPQQRSSFKPRSITPTHSDWWGCCGSQTRAPFCVAFLAMICPTWFTLAEAKQMNYEQPHQQ